MPYDTKSDFAHRRQKLSEEIDRWYAGKRRWYGKGGIWIVPNNKEPEVGDTHTFFDPNTGAKKQGKVTFYHTEEGIHFDDGETVHKLKAFHQ